MTLIDCYKCGKQISDRAPACPRCGAPVLTYKKLPDGSEAGYDENGNKTHTKNILTAQNIGTMKTEN